MHWGNLARFASFLRMGTITSSTRAQKCSRELGWISPQVMWFRRFFPSSGKGSASRLTKNTPLFLKLCFQLFYYFDQMIIFIHLRGLGQSVCIWSCPPIFCEMINTWGRSELECISVCQIKETFLFANHLYKQSFLERSAFKIIEQKNNYLRDFFFTFLRILRFYMLKTRNVKSYFESFPRWRLCSSEITSLAHFSGFSLMLLRV